MKKNGSNQKEDNLLTLPAKLRGYTNIALYGLFIGTLLCLFSLFTNAVPDPSFPWFSLPESLRLPFAQPLIEHWPITYTIGIWLWIIGFPALFLKGYQWFVVKKGNSTALRWLIGYPILAMLGWTTYCRFFWPKLEPATWNAPSYTLVCWLYCSSYEPMWSNITYGIAGIGIIGIFAAYFYTRQAKYLIGAFGVLAFPLGIPAIFEAYRRHYLY